MAWLDSPTFLGMDNATWIMMGGAMQLVALAVIAFCWWWERGAEEE